MSKVRGGRTMANADIPAIDWTPFDGSPPMTLTCKCDRTWRSHATVLVGLPPIAKNPCPGCFKRGHLVTAEWDSHEQG